MQRNQTIIFLSCSRKPPEPCSVHGTALEDRPLAQRLAKWPVKGSNGVEFKKSEKTFFDVLGGLTDV